MTRSQALSQARQTFVANDIEDAWLESELLLRYTLSLNRVELYLDLNRALSPEQEATFWKLIDRRLSGEPTAYITGHREFYGLDFYVDPKVLIPRPETELVVDKALSLAQNHLLMTIVDVGTGSSAIAISLALKLHRARIYATDVSTEALQVARLNCQKHGVADRVCLLEGNMLDPLPEPVDLIVANLPYVKASALPQVSHFEPVVALDGGADGLDKIRQLCQQLSYKLRPDGFLVLEMGQGQRNAVTSLLDTLFPGATLEITPDLGGIDRVATLSLT